MDVQEEIEVVPPHPRQEDLIDWHGCTAVRFDPLKLGGRATVGATRMDADGVLINYESGMSAEEISEAFSSDLEAVRTIIAFAESKIGPIPRPQRVASRKTSPK